MTTKEIGRREFIKVGATAGAGLLIGFRLLDAAESNGLPGIAGADDFSPNAYLRIGTDGAITLFADHVELGQGVMTALPMIVADELDADWTMVRVQRMSDDPSAWPRSIMTVGSQSVRGSWSPLRKAGATAREMLLAAGAQQFGVDRAQCRTDKGFVVHAASGRKVGYGAVASLASTLPVPQNPTLKDPKDFHIIGTHAPRVDIPSKVNGSAQFGIDVRLPGMLYATVIRPPVWGGKIASVDAARAKAVTGVKDVVQFQNGVAVLATDTWSALKGRRALSVQWVDGPNASLTSADIRRQFTELAASAGTVMGSPAGDAASALASASKRISADYELPYAAHATMEPMNCTAHVRPDGVDVWAPTQAPTSFQRYAAQLAGVSPNAVRLHVTMVGGGFGRRSRTDFLDDAVRLSKMTGAPVKVMWTREDDMQHDAYRPFGIHRLEGAIGADGWPVAWTHRIVTQNALGPGDSAGGAMDLPYAIPNRRVELVAPTIAVPVSPWRSVGHSQNGFVTEGFLDELAAAAGKDPVAFRRRLLADAPRHLAAMELAVSKSDWGKPMPSGSGRGIAVHAMAGSYVAQIAEVTVANDAIRVNKVVCGVDCGVVINPNTLASQIEGGIIYGLTCALKNEITIKDGHAEQQNFNTYPMLRMSEAPVVEVYTVPSTEAPGGIGEPGVPPIAAAVANAVFAATGKRLRKLPLRLT